MIWYLKKLHYSTMVKRKIQVTECAASRDPGAERIQSCKAQAGNKKKRPPRDVLSEQSRQRAIRSMRWMPASSGCVSGYRWFVIGRVCAGIPVLRHRSGVCRDTGASAPAGCLSGRGHAEDHYDLVAGDAHLDVGRNVRHDGLLKLLPGAHEEIRVPDGPGFTEPCPGRSGRAPSSGSRKTRWARHSP